MRVGVGEQKEGKRYSSMENDIWLEHRTKFMVRDHFVNKLNFKHALMKLKVIAVLRFCFRPEILEDPWTEFLKPKPKYLQFLFLQYLLEKLIIFKQIFYLMNWFEIWVILLFSG